MSRQPGDQTKGDPGQPSGPAAGEPTRAAAAAPRPMRTLLDEEAEGPQTLTNLRAILPEWARVASPTVAPLPVRVEAAPSPAVVMEEPHPIFSRPWLSGLLGAAAMLFVLALIQTARRGGEPAPAALALASAPSAAASVGVASTPPPEAVPALPAVQSLVINFPDGGVAISDTTALPQWALSCARVVVEGHTCNQGSPRENLRTGEERARAVRDRLVAFGVTADQIVVRSKGDTAPIADNRTGEGRRRNRRVEVRCAGDGA